jgi:hypothetical protein
MRENSTLEVYASGWNPFFHRNEYNILLTSRMTS